MILFGSQNKLRLEIILFGVFFVASTVSNAEDSCSCTCPKSRNICDFAAKMKEKISKYTALNELLSNRTAAIIDAALRLLPDYIERVKMNITKRILDQKKREREAKIKETCDDHDDKCFCNTLVKAAPEIKNGIPDEIEIEYEDCDGGLVMKGSRSSVCKSGKLHPLPPICVCQQGTYGVNCEQTCRCANGTTCDEVTGACKGECLEGWGGRSCNIKLDPNANTAFDFTSTMETF